jgi:hypothetical protein
MKWGREVCGPFSITGNNPLETLQPELLYHYTNETSLQAILKGLELRPSLAQARPQDVRYGDGQYLCSVPPGSLSGAQLSRLLLGHPFSGHRFTHYLAIDVSGLEVHQGRAEIFVVPNSGNLDLTGRILSTGRNSA